MASSNGGIDCGGGSGLLFVTEKLIRYLFQIWSIVVEGENVYTQAGVFI